MWGLTIQFWQSVVFWANIVAFAAGFFAVAALFVSALVSPKIADVIQRDADSRIAEARTRGDEARADAARANQLASEATERASALEKENLGQREKIVSIENDTARTLALLAWRRLNDHELRILSDGLREPKIDDLRVSARAGDPEAELFADDILGATKDAGYNIRMGKTFNPTMPFFGLEISGPAQDVARLVALFAQTRFPDVARREMGPRNPVSIVVGSKPPPKPN
jgi:hypothetical protein